MGLGRLQTKGQKIDNLQIDVTSDNMGIYIKGFQSEMLELSQMDFMIDWYHNRLEKFIHEKLNPNVEWPGFYPDKL